MEHCFRCCTLFAATHCWKAPSDGQTWMGELCDRFWTSCRNWMRRSCRLAAWRTLCWCLLWCIWLAQCVTCFSLLTKRVFDWFWLNQLRSTKVCKFNANVDTVHGHSTTLKVAMPIILGYFIYDLLLAALISEAGMEKLIVLHHILCVVVWPISYHYQAGCFYVLYMMAAELSTPFLWLVVYFLPKYKVEGTVYTALGLLMVLVFFLVRILPGPALLKSLVASQSHWQDVNPVVYALAMLTLPLPSVLFGYWFLRILSGMLAALSDQPEKKEAWERLANVAVN